MLFTRLPPPLVILLLAGAMSLATDLSPELALPLPLHASWGVAGLCALLSLLLGGWALWSFRRAGTTVDPRHPEKTRQLVTAGIYRLSRNPMYLALLLLLLAWALLLANALALLGVPLCFFYLDRLTIRYEEQHLQRKFGATYRDYQQRTRRWL